MSYLLAIPHWNIACGISCTCLCCTKPPCFCTCITSCSLSLFFVLHNPLYLWLNFMSCTLYMYPVAHCIILLPIIYHDWHLCSFSSSFKMTAPSQFLFPAPIFIVPVCACDL